MVAISYTTSGNKATAAVKLDNSIFAVDIKNHELLKDAYTAYLSNGRQNLAITKTRGLVSGGGRKPWKQKGTGRARFGSSRNPIWTGGGIVFGPTGQENYKKKLNLKAKRQAIRQALSTAAIDNKITTIAELKVNGKTAELAKLLKKIGAVKNTLLVVEQKTPELIRISRNLKSTKVSSAKYLNVFDVLNADVIIFTNDAMREVNLWLGTAA